jgi:hypothetical protein
MKNKKPSSLYNLFITQRKMYLQLDAEQSELQKKYDKLAKETLTNMLCAFALGVLFGVVLYWCCV